MIKYTYLDNVCVHTSGVDMISWDAQYKFPAIVDVYTLSMVLMTTYAGMHACMHVRTHTCTHICYILCKTVGTVLFGYSVKFLNLSFFCAVYTNKRKVTQVATVYHITMTKLVNLQFFLLIFTEC